MNCYINHLKTVVKHKCYVFQFCNKAGIPWRGLMHDMSKFHPIEFFESAKYWNGTRSPIDNAKDDKGYAIAWQHHKGHNPHHPEYWIDNVMIPGQEPVPLIMPYEYALEMVCDWCGASKAYNKNKDWKPQDSLDWFYEVGSKRRIHPAILNFAESVLNDMVELGVDEALSTRNTIFNYHCSLTYQKAIKK